MPVWGPRPAGIAGPYLQLTTRTHCVDDPASRHYNRIVEAVVEPDWKSSEPMFSYGRVYSLGKVIHHNEGDPTPTPGAGSCIFFHIWRSPGRPTLGCTAMKRNEL